MLGNVHKLFTSNHFNLSLGVYFKAQLLQTPVSATKNDFLPARRFLKLDSTASTSPGHIIQTLGGTKYLCQERGLAEFQNELIYKTLRLYQVTDTVPVTIATSSVDSIIGRPVQSGQDQSLGTLDLAIEPTVLESDGMRSQTRVVRVISNIDLPLNAVVNSEYKITDSVSEGGLFFLTASKL